MWESFSFSSNRVSQFVRLSSTLYRFPWCVVLLVSQNTFCFANISSKIHLESLNEYFCVYFSEIRKVAGWLSWATLYCFRNHPGLSRVHWTNQMQLDISSHHAFFHSHELWRCRSLVCSLNCAYFSKFGRKNWGDHFLFTPQQKSESTDKNSICDLTLGNQFWSRWRIRRESFSNVPQKMWNGEEARDCTLKWSPKWYLRSHRRKYVSHGLREVTQ